MKAGSAGFNGVFTNFHPDLYRCARKGRRRWPTSCRRSSSSSAVSEALGYPALAKLHQRIGTFASIRCRVIRRA